MFLLFLYKITLFDQLILFKFVLKIIHLQGKIETFGPLVINTYVIIGLEIHLEKIRLKILISCQLFPVLVLCTIH